MYDIVCFSTSDWDFPIGSRQQIMRRLAQRHRVLFVEYQASWLHPLRYASLRKRFEGAGRLRQISASLWIYTPPLSVPFGTYQRRVNQWNQKHLVGALKPILSQVRFRRPLLWIYTPLAADAIEVFGDIQGVVYHAIEAHAAEKNMPLREKVLQGMETDVLERADLVLVMSEHLGQAFKTVPKKTVLLTSAVDEAVFFGGSSTAFTEDRDLERISSPRLGFVGNLDSRKINISLLHHLMQTRGDWSLVLVGRVLEGQSAFVKLFQLPNVHYLGERPLQTIPHFLKQMDVCLLPYHVNGFTEGISPLKLFEYLAMGKPVVSTPLKESQHLNGLVYLADDLSTFAASVQSAIGEKGGGRRDRIDFARQQTWKNRVAQIESLLQEAFPC